MSLPFQWLVEIPQFDSQSHDDCDKGNFIVGYCEKKVVDMGVFYLKGTNIRSEALSELNPHFLFSAISHGLPSRNSWQNIQNELFHITNVGIMLILLDMLHLTKANIRNWELGVCLTPSAWQEQMSTSVLMQGMLSKSLLLSLDNFFLHFKNSVLSTVSR